MSILSQLISPADLARLSDSQFRALAASVEHQIMTSSEIHNIVKAKLSQTIKELDVKAKVTGI
jgi:hypothetical protein